MLFFASKTTCLSFYVHFFAVFIFFESADFVQVNLAAVIVESSLLKKRAVVLVLERLRFG